MKREGGGSVTVVGREAIHLPERPVTLTVEGIL